MSTEALLWPIPVPHAAKPLSVPKVEPPPVAEKISVAGKEAVKRGRKRRGWAESVITGALAPATGKKTTLG